MDNRNKALVISILITILYSFTCYYLISYHTGLFSTIICLPFVLVLMVSYGMGDGVAYFFLFLEVILIWYLIFWITKKILNNSN